MRVRQAVELGGSRPEVVLAGDALTAAACENLAVTASGCSAALEAGIYPRQAELAGTALQRLRSAIDGAARSK